jgi:hypothetical protein
MPMRRVATELPVLVCEPTLEPGAPLQSLAERTASVMRDRTRPQVLSRPANSLALYYPLVSAGT